MTKEITKRHIRLQPKSRPCQTTCRGLKEVPWLSMSGVWLEQAGFDIGDQVEITVQRGQLIIRQMSECEEGE